MIWACLVLVATPLLVQNVFLMLQVQKLTNKLMSRNYSEYMLAQTQESDQTKNIAVNIPVDEPDTDLNIMRDFTS